MNNDGMEALAVGKKVVRENPEMLERWYGASRIDQTGGIKTAEGTGTAEEIIADALGL